MARQLLGQHTFFDMSVNIGQTKLSTLVAEVQFLVIDPIQVLKWWPSSRGHETNLYSQTILMRRFPHKYLRVLRGYLR